VIRGLIAREKSLARDHGRTSTRHAVMGSCDTVAAYCTYGVALTDLPRADWVFPGCRQLPNPPSRRLVDATHPGSELAPRQQRRDRAPSGVVARIGPCCDPRG